MREHRFIKILSASLAFPLLTLLIGCGSSRPEAEDVIGKAIDAIEKVQTYRVDGAATNTQDGETTQSSVRMEFVSPDRLRAITVDERGTGESIRIGQTEYRLDAGDDNWQVRQWPESFRSYNLAANMVKSLDSLIGLVELEDEEVDGVDCFHYKGSVDMKARGEEEKAKLDPSQPNYEERMRHLELYDRWQCSSEFWVGKEDFLLRQLKQHQEVVLLKGSGEEVKEKHQTSTITYRFLNFNAPIKIEPPAAELIEGIRLTAGIVGSVGGKDLQHHQIKYEITISNKGIEVAINVRVFVDSRATNQGLQTMEAEPAHRPVNLGPDESETFLVSWEYDFTRSSKEEFLKLIKQNVLRTIWIDEKGQQGEKVLRKGG